MKLWLQRPRPIELTGLPEVFSFPSGHTTFATVTLGVLAVLASHGLRSWGKAVVFAAAGIAVIAIAYSRIYLGAHWMSDVLGGFLFGAVMIAAFGIAIEAVPSRRIQPLGLTLVALLAFCLPASSTFRATIPPTPKSMRRARPSSSMTASNGNPAPGRACRASASISPAAATSRSACNGRAIRRRSARRSPRRAGRKRADGPGRWGLAISIRSAASTV